MATAKLTPARVGIHHVLIATDFSRYSAHAIDLGLRMARRTELAADLVYVVPSDALMMTAPEAYAAARDLAVRDLDDLKLKLNAAYGCTEGDDYRLHLLEGDVAEAILRCACQRHSDVIVLGTHGRSGVGKALMGSVAERIFRNSPIPVITIGPFARSDAAVSPKRILVPVDFSPASERAVHFALALAAEEQGACVTLLHVVDPKELAQVPDRDRVVHELKEKVVALAGPNNAGKFVARVEVGRVNVAVIDVERELHADLVVMGVHTKGVLQRLLWPHAYKIVCESSCPVLTVR